jgi:hypothetical protein
MTTTWACVLKQQQVLLLYRLRLRLLRLQQLLLLLLQPCLRMAQARRVLPLHHDHDEVSSWRAMPPWIADNQ